jgi:hypothetical protein
VAFDFRERWVEVSVAVGVAAAAVVAVSVAFFLRLFFVLVLVVSVAVAGACAKMLTVPNPRTNAVAVANNLKWFFIFLLNQNWPSITSGAGCLIILDMRAAREVTDSKLMKRHLEPCTGTRRPTPESSRST